MTRSFLLVLAPFLIACGEPGSSDAVFVRALPGNKGAQPTADSARAAALAGPRMDIRKYRGMYFRDGDVSEFQPCGTGARLPVTGTGEGRSLLAERFRWNAPWQGRPMFAVLTGAIVLDTLGNKRAVNDSTPADTVRRFFVTGVDTVRTWENECPGMQLKR